MRRHLASAAAMALIAHGGAALAYRPFDSTDADVAHAGEAEIELGPVQWLKEGSRRFVHAPAMIANFGLSGERELVIEGRHEIALDREPDEPGSSLVDNGVSIKQVLRPGVLQEESGPSVATEYGLSLPATHGARKTGFSIAAIVSQRWQAATVHLNGALLRTRQGQPGGFLGSILEGPYAWAVRPVAEVFTERASDTPRIDSLLVGAIWRVRDGLALDAGARSARIGDESIHELRLGLTWAFSIRGER